MLKDLTLIMDETVYIPVAPIAVHNMHVIGTFPTVSASSYAKVLLILYVLFSACQLMCGHARKREQKQTSDWTGDTL